MPYQVPRDAARWRQDGDQSRMGELFRLGHVRVAESDGLRELADRGLRSGQEMEAGARAVARVVLQICGLLRRGECGGFARIDAHGDELEVLAGVEGQLLQRGNRAVEHEGAQHRAVVVREHQNDRSRAEEVAEPDRASSLVDERQVEGNLAVQVLIDPDVAEDWHTGAGWHGRRGIACGPHGLGEGWRAQQGEQQHQPPGCCPFLRKSRVGTHEGTEGEPRTIVYSSTV